MHPNGLDIEIHACRPVALASFLPIFSSRNGREWKCEAKRLVYDVIVSREVRRMPTDPECIVQRVDHLLVRADLSVTWSKYATSKR